MATKKAPLTSTNAEEAVATILGEIRLDIGALKDRMTKLEIGLEATHTADVAAFKDLMATVASLEEKIPKAPVLPDAMISASPADLEDDPDEMTP